MTSTPATSCRSRRDAFVVPAVAGRPLSRVGVLRRQLARPDAEIGRSKRLDAELDGWGRLGVEAWFDGEAPWLERAGSTRSSIARLVGAHEDEVVVMNTLTVNLHLLLASFYRPDARPLPDPDRGLRLPLRLACGAEPGGAARSRRRRWRCVASRRGRARPRCAPRTSSRRSSARATAWRSCCSAHVNYLTGELLDMRAITAATRGRGGERLGSRARDRQRPRRAARRGRRLRGLVPLQVRQRRARARPAGPSSTRVMRPTRPGSGSQAGGGSIRPTGFAWSRTSWPGQGAEGWAVSTPPILALAAARGFPGAVRRGRAGPPSESGRCA